jgi:hypothetical protein
MKMQRRTFLAASLTALASTASLTVRAAAGAPKAAFVISVSGSMDRPAAKSWGKLTGELRMRGVRVAPNKLRLSNRQSETVKRTSLKQKR